MSLNRMTPSALAASMNVISLITNTEPRTMRTNGGVDEMPIASTTLGNPGPTMLMTRRANRTDGNAKPTSTARMIRASVAPPAFPAINPSSTPRVPEMAIASKPSTRE